MIVGAHVRLVCLIFSRAVAADRPSCHWYIITVDATFPTFGTQAERCKCLLRVQVTPAEMTNELNSELSNALCVCLPSNLHILSSGHLDHHSWTSSCSRSSTEAVKGDRIKAESVMINSSKQLKVERNVLKCSTNWRVDNNINVSRQYSRGRTSTHVRGMP